MTEFLTRAAIERMVETIDNTPEYAMALTALDALTRLEAAEKELRVAREALLCTCGECPYFPDWDPDFPRPTYATCPISDFDIECPTYEALARMGEE